MKKLLLIVCLVTSLGICTKTLAQAPTITSFTPISAKPEDSVTLTGTNFSATATENIVFFGATKATVTAATATSLTVTVPNGATYAPITVLNTGTNLAVYSTTKFNPIYSPAKTNITAADFKPKVDFATGDNPYSVAIGDLDGDGKPDLVVVNRSSNSVSVFRNTSSSGAIASASFATKVDFATGSFPGSVTIGDLDGDGKLDIVVANYLSSSVSVFRNTSVSGDITTASFDASVDFTTNSFPSSVAIGDLDGDGKPDFAVSSYTTQTVSVFHNTSTIGSFTTGSFAPKVDFTTGTQTISVAIGDLDGDSKPELVVTSNNTATVSVLKNTSTTGSISASSFAARVDFTTGSGPRLVVIGDLDGDGKPDLATANYSSGSVSVLRNTSTTGNISASSFAAKVDFSFVVQATSLAISDLDGDGKPDLAMTSQGSDKISVFRNTSTSGSIITGSFAPKVDFTTGALPYSIAIGDLDGDGKPDLVAANYIDANISILQNIYLPPAITSFTPISAKPGDAVTITGTNFNTIDVNNVVFFGATQAAVTASMPDGKSLTVTLPTGATYAPITVLNTQTNLATFSLKNFNPNYNPAKTNITTTDFKPKQDFATGNKPYTVAIGDLDGDGKPDLVVANETSNSISVYRNISTTGIINSSSFANKVDFTTGSAPREVTIGDIDGDGKLDLAVTNQNSNSVSVFRNIITSGSITSASFAAKVDFTTGSTPRTLIIRDLDGDGKNDLTVVNGGSNSISILRNVGSSGSITSSSFDPKVDFATGTLPYPISIGDLDGDGKPDIAVTNFLSNTVSVFRNTTTSGSFTASSFTSKVDFATETNPGSVIIGDLDGDGKLDMAVTNQGSASISVFRNNISTSGSFTAASFDAKVDFATGSTPHTVVIGDLNGDGKPDLAVGNYGSASISVIRNTSFSGLIDLNSFAAKVDLTTQNGPVSIAIGDLDGDGRPDLTVANYNSNSVSIFRNTSNNPNLSALTLSEGSLSPSFSANTITYTSFVGSTVNDITVTPTNADANATIQVRMNGGTYATVTSGAVSGSLTLNEGDNTVDVKVTAEDATTTKTYSITVTKATVLPVSFISFDAKLNNSGTVDLVWKTASEKNNSHFIILKSADGVNFSEFAKINANGQSNLQNRYQSVDRNPVNGNNYYRLVQYDVDGKATILSTTVVTVNLENNNTVTVFPNPAKDVVNVKFAAGIFESLKLVDLMGKVLISKSVAKNSSLMSLEVASLPVGTYIIRMESKVAVVTTVVIKK